MYLKMVYSVQSFQVGYCTVHRCLRTLCVICKKESS